MVKIQSFHLFEKEKFEPLETLGSSNSFNPVNLWNKDSTGDYHLDKTFSRKLIRVAKDFFSQFSDLLGDKEIKDIQLTGDFCNDQKFSSGDLDLHVIVDFSGLSDSVENLEQQISKRKFDWDLNNPLKVRGYDLDVYLNDFDNQHEKSGLYSLLNDRWITKGNQKSLLDPRDSEKKFKHLLYVLDSIENKLTSPNLSEDAKNKIFEKAHRLKRRVQRMRRNSDPQIPSVNSETFKKLKKKGYIEKLVRNLLRFD